MRLSLVTLVVCVAFLTTSCNTGRTGSDEADLRAEKKLAQMTLDEKIGQMSQLDISYFRDPDQLKKAVREGRCGSLLNFQGAEQVNEIQHIAVEETRLGIPLIIGRDIIHGYRTIFPIPLGMAASWNPEIVKQAFRISAIEASSQGDKMDLCAYD